MGFYYRKRVSTGRGRRASSWANVSRSGVSESVHAGRVTVNSRGSVRVRLGKGFFWRAGKWR